METDREVLERHRDSQLARLRRFEQRIHEEFTAEEIEQVGGELLGISNEIKKIETGQVWFVVGPEGKIFRAEKTR